MEAGQLRRARRLRQGGRAAAAASRSPSAAASRRRTCGIGRRRRKRDETGAFFFFCARDPRVSRSDPAGAASDLAGAVRFGGRTYRDRGVEAALRRRPGRRDGGGGGSGAAAGCGGGDASEPARVKNEPREKRRPALGSYVAAVRSRLPSFTILQSAQTDFYQIRKIVSFSIKLFNLSP